jgi:hypothetical protein
MQSLFLPKTMTKFFGCSPHLKSSAFEGGPSLVLVEQRLIWSCSTLESICVPASVEVLCSRCFAGLSNLSSLAFESGSQLREIEQLVFSRCRSLKSICLPASLSVVGSDSFVGSFIETVSVDEANPNSLVAFKGMTIIRHFEQRENAIVRRDICILGKRRFMGLSFLVSVAFEDGSQLTQIQASAFMDCSRLQSICIPSRVKIIGDSSFESCLSLSELIFESGSKLNRIGDRAFCGCRALRSITVPSQLEWIRSDQFLGCESVSELRFELPSRLTQIYVPSSNFTVLSLPDSVEVVRGSFPKLPDAQMRHLQFGRESHLREIDFNMPCPWNPLSRASSLFASIPEKALRRFRERFEGYCR